MSITPKQQVIRVLVYEGTPEWIRHVMEHSTVRGTFTASEGNTIKEHIVSNFLGIPTPGSLPHGAARLAADNSEGAAAVKPVMYAIGTRQQDTSYAMWFGPTPEIEKAKSQVGSEGDVILRLNPNGTQDEMYYWNIHDQKWLEDDVPF